MVFPTYAKRIEPKPVSPVTVGSITYSAPRHLMGVVVATDTVTKKEIWRKHIYRIHYTSSLEKDVQDIFISSLVLEDDNLLISNERGECFSLNLKSRKVRKLTSIK
jgi:hypothetical protein